jgi:hypothetical protein
MMQKYQNTILTTAGTPAVGASVTVLNYPSLSPATIYSSVTGTPVANPLTTSGTGYFSFYAVNGHYTLSVSGGSLLTTQFTDIILNDGINTAGSIQVGAGSTCGVNTTIPLQSTSSGTYPSQLQVVGVPANTLGINGQMDIQFSVTTSNTSGIKNFYITWNGVVVGPTFSITTEVSTTGIIRIRNAGATNAQVVSVLSTDGQSTSAFPTLSMDTTKSSLVILWGACATNADSINLSGFNVTYYNPPVIPTPPPLIPGSTIFWGVNSHPDEFTSGPDFLQCMQLLNCGILRLDWASPTDNANIIATANAFAGTGIQLYILVSTTGMNSAVNTAYTSEAAAYSANFTLAQTCATALIPHGITLFECANELDAALWGSTEIRTPGVFVQGTYSADYISGSFFPIFRGACNGTTDGVRAAATSLGATNVLVASNAFTNASIWLSDALWTGTDINGTPGFQPCKWDITAWHAYGNATMLGPATQYSGGGGTSNFNLLEYISNAYGKPIIISEFNPSLTPGSTNASTTTSWMAAWLAVQAQYNIASVMFYDLFDVGSGQPGTTYYNLYLANSPPFNNTSNLNATGLAFKAFTAANPAPR